MRRRTKPACLTIVSPADREWNARAESDGSSRVGGRNCGYDNDRLRDRVFVGKTDVDPGRQPRRRDLGEPGRRTAGQRHRRLAAAQIDDPHVAPEDAAAEARTERLRTCLLRREPLGIACDAVGAPFRTLPLDLGKAPVQEALAEALQGVLDPADIDQIAAD